MSMKDFVDTLNDEQKAALLAALNTSSQDDNINTSKDTKRKNEEDFTMHRQNSVGQNSRREQVRSRGNTWSDTGSEAKNVTTPEIQRTPRTRNAPRKKEVKCSSCGSKSMINANLVYGEYYRCDRCVK